MTTLEAIYWGQPMQLWVKGKGKNRAIVVAKPNLLVVSVRYAVAMWGQW